MELYKESLASYKRVLPPDHPDIAMSMNDLASLYTDLGRHDEARKLFV